MFFRAIASLSIAASLAVPLMYVAQAARAQSVVLIQDDALTSEAQIADLSQALQMQEIVQIMQSEGIDYAKTLEEEMFPGRGGAEWARIVAGIYDPETMLERFDDQLVAELRDSPEAVSSALEFFADERGQRILTLELEARRALVDDAAEEAARVAVEDMIANSDPRMDVLRRFAETNALVELNVAGAMNANLAFYKGMDEGGAFDGKMTEDEMLSDVWGQEADVRAQTEEWMYSFLALAYSPLSDTDMDAYQAFSESDAGQKVNAALFAAYDSVFTPISRDLGLAAARFMQGQDI
jgi:hypothetical protein